MRRFLSWLYDCLPCAHEYRVETRHNLFFPGFRPSLDFLVCKKCGHVGGFAT